MRSLWAIMEASIEYFHLDANEQTPYWLEAPL